MRRVDFLAFRDHRGIFDHYTRQFRLAFERRGAVCRVFDLEEGNTRQHLADLFARPPDLLFGVSCTGREPLLLTPGYDCREGGEWDAPLLCDQLLVPYVSYNLDPPVHVLHHMHAEQSVLAVVDDEARLLLQDAGLPRMLFLPHAADPKAQAGEAERPYDVVFIGACIDYRRIEAEWQASLPRPLYKACRHAAMRLLQEPHLILKRAFGEEVAPLLAGVSPGKAATLFWQIDDYARGRDRVELIRGMSPLPVHLFGSDRHGDCGWDHYLGDCSHVALHPTISFEASLALMRRTKVLLNSTPQFKGGMHDRILNASMAGAAVLTTRTPYVSAQFGEEEMGLYDHGHWPIAKNFVHLLLCDETRRAGMANRAREKVLKSHTWDHRVATLLRELTLMPRGRAHA